jgi:hypothetical protein
MGLLSHKAKVTIEDFCRGFYDTQIFHPPIVAGEDVGEAWWGMVYNSIVEADESFGGIEKALFIRQMTALRLELFALAWGHKFKQERFTVPQSIFTRQYLIEKGKLELWDIMREYNHAVANNVYVLFLKKLKPGKAVADCDMKIVKEAQRLESWCETNIIDLSATSRKVYTGSPSVDGFSVSISGQVAQTEKGKILVDCIARVANRIGADVKEDDCRLVKQLGALLRGRLSYTPKLEVGGGYKAFLAAKEAFFKLETYIFGLYEGAMEAIKSISLRV